MLIYRPLNRTPDRCIFYTERDKAEEKASQKRNLPSFISQESRLLRHSPQKKKQVPWYQTREKSPSREAEANKKIATQKKSKSEYACQRKRANIHFFRASCWSDRVTTQFKMTFLFSALGGCQVKLKSKSSYASTRHQSTPDRKAYSHEELGFPEKSRNLRDNLSVRQSKAESKKTTRFQINPCNQLSTK